MNSCMRVCVILALEIDSVLIPRIPFLSFQIMAYGQTGSGKTFTMGSEAHSESSAIISQPGLIPRFMQDMFHSLKNKKEASDDEKGPVLLDYSVQASFLEVYGEDVHDLTDKDRTALPLREDSQGGVVVTGLKSQSVSTAEEALNVLHIGTLNRTTAATLMNLTSSRSHAVFTIQLIQSTRGGGDLDVKTMSKFTFVDLAGSERMKKTGAEGERAKEGIKINEGLLALGNVINALADDERFTKKEKTHVPYRQSKLTRLLQDALGGNSQTLFLACVSPADINSSETLSTLHYANRARNIKNAPTKNVDSVVTEMQRLYALNHILMNELVKFKFQIGSEGNGDENIGVVDEALMQQKNVQNYLMLVQKTANEHQGTVLTTLPDAFNVPAPMEMMPPSGNPVQLAFEEFDTLSITTPARFKRETTQNSTFKDSAKKFDEHHTFAGISPDEELAILDQLLDLQQKDQDYDQEQKRDQMQLKLVNGELEEHSAMLLQLKDSLMVYHSMKEKYEALMTEVQQLELEKASLADQLERVVADPTKGCSLAIKKKVEKVEASLARARNDARKHQQMYRKAEQQAKKCEALELKISELRVGRVNLIKKQKESAAKHREYTENKTREISLLKRKEHTDGQKYSKLQTQLRIHEKNLEKRNVYCSKLTEKLKQTELHLLKLLSMRQRDLQDRMKPSPNKQSGFRTAKKSKAAHFFADHSEELSSMTLLLERFVSGRVSQAQMRTQYEDRVAEYSAVIRSLRSEVAVLEDLRQQGKSTNEAEEHLEDLELKCELIGSEMEDLRIKLAYFTSDEQTGSTKQEDTTHATVGNLSAPLARRLLWDFVQRYATTELENQNLGRAMDRKESALQSMESEVETLNKKIKLCTDELAERRALGSCGSDPFVTIKELQASVFSLKGQLKVIEVAKELVEKSFKKSKMTLAVKDLELAETREKLMLSEVILRQASTVHASEETLAVLQGIWRELGISLEDREAVRLQIMSCLEDTCKRKLDDANAMKSSTRNGIAKFGIYLAAMQRSLGLPDEKGGRVGGTGNTLLEVLDGLKSEVDLLQPAYDAALERRAKITGDLMAIMSSLSITEEDISFNLKHLIKVQEGSLSGSLETTEIISKSGSTMKAVKMRDVHDMIQPLDSIVGDGLACEGIDDKGFSPPGSLEASFLDKCERELSDLRLSKTEKLAANAKSRDETHLLTKQMHMSADNIAALSERFHKDLPDWWQKDVATDVACCISDSDFIIKATPVFTQHLNAMKSAMLGVADQRRVLSRQLKEIVDRAQKTLLMTVDGELDASEAYASFHDALFQLPPLSQEHIEALITEMDALISGVDAMTQSEIEALTVVWEALGITTSERGKFWGNLEKATKSLRSQNELPFAEVSLAGSLFVEAWVLQAAKEAAKVYCQMDVRLLKLENVHNEVERLRSKQDAKSRILSLDSEIRILSARLDDFEDKKCNKERLLSKKTGSCSLLQEERFRKQMQGKFTAQLEQLASLLKAWHETEHLKFDAELLSEEVRSLVENPDRMNNAVEKRTAFMHLRTVRTKTAGAKRSAEKRNSDDSPAKRQKSSETTASKSPQQHRPVRSTRAAEAQTASSRTRLATTTADSSSKRKTASQKVESPWSKARRTDPNDALRGPLSPSLQRSNPRQATKEKESKTSRFDKTKRDTLNPFGNLLPVSTSPNKENFSS